MKMRFSNYKSARIAFKLLNLLPYRKRTVFTKLKGTSEYYRDDEYYLIVIKKW